MNFYVGQEVLCIKTHSMSHINGLVKGTKWEIQAIRKSLCTKCDYILLDVGIPAADRALPTLYCSKHGNTSFPHGGVWWIASDLFAPIDNTLSETTVEELLNEPQPC